MSYHPYIAHFVARCYNLMVVKAVCNIACRALNAFVYIIAYKASTKALRLIKLIIVKLRLWMMVRRIA